MRSHSTALTRSIELLAHKKSRECVTSVPLVFLLPMASKRPRLEAPNAPAGQAAHEGHGEPSALDSKIEDTVKRFKLSRRNARSLIFHVLTDPDFNSLLTHAQSPLGADEPFVCLSALYSALFICLRRRPLWLARHREHAFAHPIRPQLSLARPPKGWLKRHPSM
jgi:hypothetical protein